MLRERHISDFSSLAGELQREKLEGFSFRLIEGGNQNTYSESFVLIQFDYQNKTESQFFLKHIAQVHNRHTRLPTCRKLQVSTKNE